MCVDPHRWRPRIQGRLADMPVLVLATIMLLCSLAPGSCPRFSARRSAKTGQIVTLWSQESLKCDLSEALCER